MMSCHLKEVSVFSGACFLDHKKHKISHSLKKDLIFKDFLDMQFQVFLH